MTRRRLAVVSHSVVARVDGDWLVKNRIGDVVDRLPDFGWEVTLVARQSPALPFLTHSVSDEVSVLGLDPAAGPRRQLQQLAELVRAVRRADRLLILMPSLFCALITLLVGRRAVVYAGHSWLHLPNVPRWRAWLEACVGRRASEVIVAGDALLRRFEPVARRASLEVPLVHSDVCRRLRSSAPPGRAHRPLRVLYVGSISRQDKGVAELIEAVKSLANVECRLVGATSQDPYCARIVADASAVSHVALCGYLDWPELRSAYEWADVLMLPSHTEGFARVVYEATAFGVALVVTPVGGLPDRLRDGRDALFVPINDPAAIRRALGMLMDDTERTLALVSSAQRTLAPAFRHDNPVAQFDEALRAA